MSRQKKIFGTDGVRGTANVEPITAGTALQLGQAAAYVFKHLESESRGRGKLFALAKLSGELDHNKHRKFLLSL